MPYEVKIGSRWGGLARNLLEVTEQRRKRQEEQEDEFRKFNHDLQKVLLQRDDLSDEATQAILSGKPLAGMPLRRTTLFQVPEGLKPYEVKDPNTGIIYRQPENGGLDIPPEPPRAPFSESPLGRFFGGVGREVGRGVGGFLNRGTVSPASPALSSPTSPTPTLLPSRPVRTATDTKTGRRVGLFPDGSLLYLDTGQPYRE